jgi:hypothetical protein
MDPQKERKLRGKAAEEMVKDRLPEIGCRLVRSYEGAEKGKKGRMHPDLEIVCSDKEMKVEVKEATAIERDGPVDANGVQRYRAGRFQLSPDAKSKRVSHKDCYALVIDNPLSDSVTIDFVKSKAVDDEFRRLSKTGESPKFPVYRVLELRGQRCFPDVGTIKADRDELEIYMDKEWNLSYKRELTERRMD